MNESTGPNNTNIDTKNEIIIHRIFQIGLFIKAFNGLWEVLAGLGILFTGTVTSFVSFLIENELLEDPNDYIAGHLEPIVAYLSNNLKAFVIIYLIGHGLINIILFFGLLKNKLWVFKVAIGVMSLFVIYQIYKITFSYSIWLSVLTILDLIMIWLTYHEYRYLKKYNHLPS